VERKTDTPLVLPASAPHAAPRSFLGGLGPSVGFGLGPNPVAQGRFFFAVQLGRAALEVGAEVSLPSTTRQGYGGGFSHQVRWARWRPAAKTGRFLYVVSPRWDALA